MPSQQDIERFTLAFHRRAVQRLREQPECMDQALQVIDRWEAAGMSPLGFLLNDAERLDIRRETIAA